jgi:hypothetical protein
MTLKSFLAAITTCREFHDILVNEIKTDEMLKMQQFENFRDFANIGDCNDSVYIDWAFCDLAAGAFWKNPWAISERLYFDSLINSTSPSSYMTLFPHLERLVRRDFLELPVVCEQIDGFAYAEGASAGHNDPREIDWAEGSFDVKYRHLRIREEDKTYITNVDSIEFEDSVNGGSSLMEQDICASPLGKWWLVIPPVYISESSAMEWILVNYSEQRMYACPCVEESLSWKGRDTFHVYSWARLKSMEAIENLRRNTRN